MWHNQQKNYYWKLNVKPIPIIIHLEEISNTWILSARIRRRKTVVIGRNQTRDLLYFSLYELLKE